MNDPRKTPSLGELAFLIGDWDTALSGGSFLPDPDQVVHGRLEIRAVENGAFLAIRQFVDVSGPPAAVWLVGRDDSHPDYTVLYADTRGVSRVYVMRLREPHWQIWRDHDEFAQRFEALIGPDRQEIVGRWEKRVNTGTWEPDFNVTYSRL